MNDGTDAKMMLSQGNFPQSVDFPVSKPRLLDQVRHVIRCKHYSIRTEHSYIDWIKRFIFSTTASIPKIWANRIFLPF